jgi:SAM-dependent methyltransferase
MYSPIFMRAQHRTPVEAASRYRQLMTWDDAYRSGRPPWDIGAPQPEIVRLAEAGVISGEIIDVGCGTGENALYLARRGLTVVGIDGAPTAIELARAKAEPGVSATFVVGDALALDRLERTFDVAIDCGLFHTFSDLQRGRFVTSLRQVVRPSGRYVMLCFSERQPGDAGPRRVTQAEIRATFADGWVVDSVEPARFAARQPMGEAQAWLAQLTRTAL